MYSASLLPLVAVSGTECVEALLHAGFARRTVADDATTLSRDGRVVIVPTSALLAPDELRAVLSDARIAYSDFLDLLSDMPTDPDVTRTGRHRALRRDEERNR
ncbi:MAG TPA: hypothetical protein VIF62_19565 [Labilithrix sp.]